MMTSDTASSTPRFNALARAMDHPRIAICGGPRTGKTTLASLVADRRVVHTDAWIALPWGEVPHAIIAECTGLDSFVVEGVQAARALRKGLEVDVVIWLDDLQGGAKATALTKGVATVFRDWRKASISTPVVYPDTNS